MAHTADLSQLEPTMPMQVHCNVQQQAQMTTTPPAADTLWARIQQAYKRAQGKGAIYQIHSKPEKLPDEVLGLDFVLHVADALNDKPKPIPTRWGGMTYTDLSSLSWVLSIQSSGCFARV